MDNDTLLSLYLEGNGITEKGAAGLSKMLKNKVKLSKVNLSCNPIGDIGMDLISEGMSRNETLRVLTIADA
jgi:Ran GTPase-activating protein (RanGAP) involved in mRNA processing and transport